MIKVLIICKDNLTAKLIVNNVTGKIHDLHLIGIANNITEGLTFLKKREPTLIITTSPKFVEILNNDCSTYTPGIVLIAPPDPDKPAVYKFRKLLLHIHAVNDFDQILNRTFRFVTDNYTTSKKRFIKEILTDIGFDFKLIGTKFLFDSLLYITSYAGASGFGMLSTDVYPFVAEKYNSKPLVVKWAIIRSIQYLYNKCDEETLEKIEAYFDIRYPEKMTPKLIITAITRMLENK